MVDVHKCEAVLFSTAKLFVMLHNILGTLSSPLRVGAFSRLFSNVFLKMSLLCCNVLSHVSACLMLSGCCHSFLLLLCVRVMVSGCPPLRVDHWRRVAEDGTDRGLPDHHAGEGWALWKALDKAAAAAETNNWQVALETNQPTNLQKTNQPESMVRGEVSFILGASMCAHSASKSKGLSGMLHVIVI